jgi:putative Mn2+ efflux pump MntP
MNFDVDSSNYIDNKEAVALALAVAVDASCVSMGAGIIGYTSFILPVFMAVFHTFFVNCGNFVAKSVVEKLNIPSNVLSMFSGILLVLIGLFRIVF